jgi:ankyrin repeat protein
MASFGRSSGGLDPFGGKRTYDDREDQPTLGLYEEAPVHQRQTLSLRFSPHDWTTLWGAAALGYCSIVNRLLRQGAPPDLCDPAGLTPLMYATDFGQVEVMCDLLVAGADANARCPAGRTAAFYVQGKRSGEILTLLRSAEADLELIDAGGRTCLMIAAERNDTSLVAGLLAAGARPEMHNEQGHSALLLALFAGARRATARLRAAGAPVGFAEALALGAADVASRLPTNVVLDAQVAGGETLLCRAARRGEFAVVYLLLERGADPNASGENGQTPLDTAARESRGRILRLLLDYGADPARAITTDAPTLRSWAGMASDGAIGV